MPFSFPPFPFSFFLFQTSLSSPCLSSFPSYLSPLLLFHSSSSSFFFVFFLFFPLHIPLNQSPSPSLFISPLPSFLSPLFSQPIFMPSGICNSCRWLKNLHSKVCRRPWASVLLWGSDTNSFLHASSWLGCPTEEMAGVPGSWHCESTPHQCQQ